MCRRCHKVSTRRELVQHVKFRGSDDWAATVQGARSLLRWMRRHGQAVRSLDVSLEPVSEIEQAEFASVLDGCITVCAGSLERLTLYLFGRSYTLGG